MRYIEIILKVLFLAGSIFAIKSETVSHIFLIMYLGLCLVLGIVLLFNKKGSYRYPTDYPRMKSVYMMRKVEGVLLIAFSIFVYVVQG